MTAPSEQGPKRPAEPWDWPLAALLSLAVFWAAHGHGFANPYAVNDDLRQQVYWMQRFQDPGLYPPDLLGDYARAYVTLGVEAVYRIASFFVDPLMASKRLTGGLFVLEALYLFALGLRLGGRATAWAAAAMTWLMPFFLDNISGALARGYASPLLALFVLATLHGRRQFAALTLLGLFIPYICLPCAAGLFAQRAAWSLRHKRLDESFASWRGWLGWAVPAGLTLANALKPQGGGFGPLVWLSETAGRPEFGPQGRLDLAPLPNPFLDFVYFPFEGVGLFKELGLAAGIVTLALLAPALWFGARAADWRLLGRALKPLAWTGGAFLVFYAAARLLAFKLFVPDRYVQYPLNLLYALLLAWCLAGAVSRRGLSRTACAGLVLAACLGGGVRLKGVALYDYSAQAPLYAAIEAATPKSALLAGLPDLMDNVMTFSRRNALVTFELAHPWSRGYWERFRPRLEAVLKAYYAQDPADVRALARDWGVDFLVVNEAHFTPEFLSGRPVFEPFGAIVRESVRGRTAFALLNPALFPRIPLAPGAFLVDVRPAGRG
ncbi:hypothetical protein NNJEOMEG_03601 [Fundidesulfovibrio magnetotacticus]|uniref:Glycosyltransferase RgtA/B/C/D-like domain-containing protein n=1 Tax=Fundidesulfovibrio magnetotacticus TaxID=2730080 RepID=A0A6V8LTE0_9BACT|nr:hypothetical protein [Fundidesulfovibrio magnetotacticus]GFK95733.1 hypothetical protein NNJEOMEG_03601 [Fundidesulfovibrio magnetotacticus]